MSELPPGWWPRFLSGIGAACVLVAALAVWLVVTWRAGQYTHMVGPALLLLPAVVLLALALRTISNPERHYVWERVLWGRTFPNFPVPPPPGRRPPRRGARRRRG